MVLEIVRPRWVVLARGAVASVVIALLASGCSAGAGEREKVSAPSSASSTHAELEPPGVAGHVVGQAGEPVAGALVSVSSHFDMHVREPEYYETLSDAQGAFVFAALPPGEYGVTATVLEGTAAYGGAIEVRPLSASAGASQVAVRDLVLRVGGPGVRFHGLVRDEKGSPLAAARVLARSFAENAGEVYVALSDADGRYVLQLPAAHRYMLVADAAPRPRAVHAVEPSSQEVNFQLAALPAPRPSDDAIAGWLKTRATPLAIDTELDARAAKAIADVVGDARVVGLGEAAHGTGDLTRSRFRVFQSLVRDKGFRVYAAEESWADALVIDDYVVDGNGDARSALRAQYNRGSVTDETLELLEWMRAYNDDLPHAQKLHFVGFDTMSARAVSEFLAYLRKVDSPAVAAAQRELRPLAGSQAHETFRALPKARQQETLRALKELIAGFEASRARYVSRSSEAAWLRGRAYARAIERSAMASLDYFLRDELMFDTLREVVAQFPAGTGFLIGAHNVHIAAEYHNLNHMGLLLRQHWGAGYVSIGSAFGEGSVYAVDWTSGPSNRLAIAQTGHAPRGTLDGDLSLAGMPAFVIDLREATGAIGAWLRSPQRQRNIGSRFLGDAASFEPMIPASSYAALMYLDRVSAHHPL